MSDSFLYTSVKDPLATPLLEELLFEYDSRYGTYFNAEGAKAELNKYPPEAFSPPSGNFLLLLRGGKAIVNGAFMRYDEETAEFKRVWTHSAHHAAGACQNSASGAGAAGDPAGLRPCLSDHGLPPAGSGRPISHQRLSRVVRYVGRS